MVNLKEKPYYLNDQQIAWVEETIANMTIEEKNRSVVCKYGRKCRGEKTREY